jgi:hypothetical protein
MQIHSANPSVNAQVHYGRNATGLLAFFGVFAICVTTYTNAHAQSGLFGESSAPSTASAASPGMVRNGLFTRGNEAFRVVDTAAFRTAADIGKTEPGSIARIGYSNCTSCGTGCGGTCGGSYNACGSCGTNCGGSCSFTLNPCAPCIPYYYASFEALAMERDGDERLSASPDFRMSDFDYVPGGRVTIGAVPNCVDGFEVTYTGNFEWDRFGLATDFGGGVRTFLAPGTPLTGADLSAFNNAIFQNQSFTARYWSVEANRTIMGWDIAKLLIGGRYLQYDEAYTYVSQNATEGGFLGSAVDNRMYGLQAGMDLLYPISRHGYTDIRTRIGGFVNSAESNFLLTNAGVLQIAANDDKTGIAGMIELDAGIRYQVGPALSIRAGFEVWYLTGVGTISKGFKNAVFPTDNRHPLNDDVLITGLSTGAELKF